MPRLLTSPATSGTSGGAPLSLTTDFNLNTSMSNAAQRAGIQNAIAAAISAHRTLSLDYKGWSIDEPLVIDGPMKLIGPNFQERWGSDSVGGTFPNMSPHGTPPMVGATITQEASNANAIEMPVRGDSVDLFGFGVMFGTLWEDTGHGIYSMPPDHPVADCPDNGLMNNVWREVSVYGHDGDHYAFDVWNNMMPRWDRLRSYGGGGFHFASDTLVTYYGNLDANDCYSAVRIAGAGHCFCWEAATANRLNAINLNRPQGWVAGMEGRPGTLSTQDCMKIIGNAPFAFTVNGEYWETTSGAKVAYPLGYTMPAISGSGAAIENESIVPMMYHALFQLDPTGGAAADVVGAIGGVRTWPGQYFTQGRLHVPAAGPTGQILSLNILVPPWYSVKFTYSNATVISSGQWPVGPLGQWDASSYS